MALARPSSVPDPFFPVSEGKRHGFGDQPTTSRWGRYIDYAILASLALFAITLPYSIKGAERSWKVAFVLWLLKLVIERARPYKQALAAPLLAYVTLSAISTLLSPDPNMSWDRMKFVCLFLVGIVVAQNLKRLSQVRWLLALLVLSGLAAACTQAGSTPMARAFAWRSFRHRHGWRRRASRPTTSGWPFAGHKVHAPGAVGRRWRKSTAREVDRLSTYAGLAVRQDRDCPTSGLSALGTWHSAMSDSPAANPIRAQGTLGHYVVFAEMLDADWLHGVGIAVLHWTWRPGWLLVFGVSFAGITAALLATETRAAVGGMVIGCVASLLYLTRRKTRVVAIALLIAMLAGAIIWIGTPGASMSGPRRYGYPLPRVDVGRRDSPGARASVVRRGNGNRTRALPRMEHSRIHPVQRDEPLPFHLSSDRGGARYPGAVWRGCGSASRTFCF